MSTASGPVPDLENVKKKWDDFSDRYSTAMHEWAIPPTMTIAGNLQLRSCTSLLEVGCGPGHHIGAILTLLPQSARYVATDYSSAMVAKAAEVAKGLPVEVSEANAQALPFADGSFDRYMANLSLMLIPDAEAAVREAGRVLRSGGVAAWSVWGRDEESPMFTAVPRLMKELGISMKNPPPPERPNFHLGRDPEVVRGMLLRSGFSRVVWWRQPSVLPLLSPTAYADHRLLQGLAEPLDAQLSPGDFARLHAAVAADAEAAFQAGRPMALDTLFFVAVKA